MFFWVFGQALAWPAVLPASLPVHGQEVAPPGLGTDLVSGVPGRHLYQEKQGKGWRTGHRHQTGHRLPQTHHGEFRGRHSGLNHPGRSVNC